MSRRKYGKVKGAVVTDFLPEFASSIAIKKEAMKEKTLRGKPNPLLSRFRKHFNSRWIPFASIDELNVSPSELDVMAVDSSMYTNLFSTGGTFYIVRSLAICRDREQRKLETDVFFTRAGSSEIQNHIVTKMEMLEFQVAVDALKNGFKCSAILIDGSLYGRAAHLPLETRIEEDHLMLLNYFEAYKELLDLCKKNNVLLAGISKESRSTFYRDYLLRLIFDEELENMDVDADARRKLKSVFDGASTGKTLDIDRLEKLKKEYECNIETIGLIIHELVSSRPDYQLIMNIADFVGYTQPMLVGPSTRSPESMRQLRLAPDKYVRSNFLSMVRERGEEFVKWATSIVSSILEFPSFASFYVLLDKRDSPIRVDVPCWDFLLSDVDCSKPAQVDLNELLKIMVTGYCGLDGYNLWLKNVDERVRLRKKIVNNIYFPYLEKLFEAKIIHGRGYRRVKYP